MQRILGWATEFVEPVAGRAAQLLEAADAWVGDGVTLLRCFHKCVHTRVQVDLFAGGILCIDSRYTLFREVVRGCVY